MPPTPHPFTPLDFQLVLLRRMADHNPGLVDEARHQLGASAGEMREANKRWQAMRHAPRGRAAASLPQVLGSARTGGTPIRTFLGAPETTSTRRIGDLTCESWLWPVPLWPTLRFEVLLSPTGAIWNEWLIRSPGTPPPTLEGLPDLTPWSCTVDEAATAFAPARPLEGTAPTRWGLSFTAPDEQGAPRQVVAEFTWGLLQRVAVRD
ncbi:hypothetical protein F3K43_30435 [Streptomyces sp. LBUM 1476]|uniref:Uncharacterized protein n=2 Tax=Streptomyces acidiscabies TaxID=42234 RepID=A0AAP6B6S8_9ACTN|nr:hypothetical protein [Streptomyces acidiscabies]MBP5939805.1 hypothetical protein [Streptomyces sp. LBUM 1476]MBZ3910986.1 hypothetical protein [Streptomyces acidiscabies]MDX2959234.1 hypothetical protein [Streptomyces acidiscabies]MDX3017622.1 hypothetical protein [Streptomyces acidiscabies]MDX3788097.1 hypothetical protein [Streptomyces acidiscabies]